MTESVQEKPKSSKEPKKTTFKVQCLFDFLQDKIGIEGLRMDVRSVCPCPVDPNSTVQYFRINFYENVKENDCNIQSVVMRTSKFVEVRIQNGKFVLREMGS